MFSVFRYIISQRMNGLPKYVVSTTLDKAAWNNSTLIKENVPQQVTKLKQQPGQDILLFGSGTLVQMLMQHDLVDQYNLSLGLHHRQGKFL